MWVRIPLPLPMKFETKILKAAQKYIDMCKNGNPGTASLLIDCSGRGEEIREAMKYLQKRK